MLLNILQTVEQWETFVMVDDKVNVERLTMLTEDGLDSENEDFFIEASLKFPEFWDQDSELLLCYVDVISYKLQYYTGNKYGSHKDASPRLLKIADRNILPILISLFPQHVTCCLAQRASELDEDNWHNLLHLANDPVSAQNIVDLLLDTNIVLNGEQMETLLSAWSTEQDVFSRLVKYAVKTGSCDSELAFTVAGKIHRINREAAALFCRHMVNTTTVDGSIIYDLYGLGILDYETTRLVAQWLHDRNWGDIPLVQAGLVSEEAYFDAWFEFAQHRQVLNSDFDSERATTILKTLPLGELVESGTQQTFKVVRMLMCQAILDEDHPIWDNYTSQVEQCLTADTFMYAMHPVTKRSFVRKILKDRGYRTSENGYPNKVQQVKTQQLWRQLSSMAPELLVPNIIELTPVCDYGIMQIELSNNLASQLEQKVAETLRTIFVHHGQVGISVAMRLFADFTYPIGVLEKTVAETLQH